MVDLAFNTPFQEQIDFLRAKLRLPTQAWDDIMRSALDRAFIVAGAAKADLLADLHQSLIDAAADGRGLDAWRRDFRKVVKDHGWEGWTGQGTKAGEAWRTRVIYQTNMATSYAAGRYRQLTDPGFLALRPYWRYIHSDSVMRPREEHLAWHGLTLPAEHEFWKTHFPPNGWGCQCRVTAVSKREGEASERAGLGAPPDGWRAVDGKSGEPVGIDKGFGYAPGRSRAELDRLLLDPKLRRLFGNTQPVAIAHGARWDAIEQVLTDFLPTFGEAVPGFKSLETAPGHFKMATWGDGRYMFSQAEPVFKAHLLDALRNIRQGAPLSADQEGMIKTLWHEIGHNRQTQLTTRKFVPHSANETLVEATNEFIALRTYPQFLRAIGGGDALHAPAVRALSGYQIQVGRVERVMQAVGLEPDALLALVERVSFEGPIDNGSRGGTILEGLTDGIAQAAKAQGFKVSKPKLRRALSLVGKDLRYFQPALNALTGGKL